MAKGLLDLVNTTSIKDADLLLVNQDGYDKSVSAKSLLSNITSICGKTPGTKGLSDLTLNLENDYDQVATFYGNGWKSIIEITNLNSTYNRGSMIISYTIFNGSTTYSEGTISFTFGGSDTTPIIASFNQHRFLQQSSSISEFSLLRVGAGAYTLYAKGTVNDQFTFKILHSRVTGSINLPLYTTNTLLTTDPSGVAPTVLYSSSQSITASSVTTTTLNLTNELSFQSGKASAVYNSTENSIDFIIN